MATILITGSHGLVGAAMQRVLTGAGHRVRCLDLRAPAGAGLGDVLDGEALQEAVEGCDGIVHLAAVSRVIWGQNDPETCRATNIGGLCHVIDAALASPRRPWLLFASSREVYGQPDHLPATEDTPLCPINIYGETKVEGERLITTARAHGLRGAIVRLSNVYGSRDDHADRVVPAFARAAATGSPLRVDGADHTFDFTHIDDTTRGLAALIDHLGRNPEPPPPIHLLTGRPTTLGQLAALAIDLAGTRSPLHDGPPRTFDVARFYGDPTRARALLDWTPRISLRDGLARLIEDFRAHPTQEVIR
jgi:UDP-glucose 4-epimerase